MRKSTYVYISIFLSFILVLWFFSAVNVNTNSEYINNLKPSIYNLIFGGKKTYEEIITLLYNTKYITHTADYGNGVVPVLKMIFYLHISLIIFSILSAIIAGFSKTKVLGYILFGLIIFVGVLFMRSVYVSYPALQVYFSDKLTLGDFKAGFGLWSSMLIYLLCALICFVSLNDYSI